MADYIDPLEEFIPTTPREMAEQIRDEYVQGANTAKRVGDCILAMLDENERILEQTTHFMDDVRRDYAQFISEKSAEIETAIRNAESATKEAKKQAESASGAAELARKNATNAASQASAAGAAASRANAAAADAEKGREEWDAQKKDVQNGIAHLNQIGEEAQTTFEQLQGEQRTAIGQAQQATTAANATSQRIEEEWDTKSEEWNEQISTAVLVSSNISLKAEKVNAQLNGSVVTITNRNGESKSVDLGGNNVKYIVLNVDVDKPLDIDKPFVAVLYTPESEILHLPESWDTAEQTREVAGYRIDSFYHIKNDKRHGGHYTICKDKYIGEILVATKLMVRADKEWVDELDGKTYDEWMEIIHEAFGEIDIVDGLDSEDPTKALSAKQGKVLDGKLTELRQQVGEMEGTDAETIAEHLPVPDYNGNAVPTRFGQPWELYGEGAPQEAVVPDNWKQFDADTGEGCNWNGLPLFIGQRYVNVLASSRALYIAVRTSYDKNSANYWSLKWLNI